MTAVELGGRLTPADATRVASALRGSRRGQTATLDLRPLDETTANGTHLDLVGISLLANVLLTTERRRAISVLVPERTTTLQQLARGGFWFSLAQRQGDTSIAVPQPDDALFGTSPAIADLGAWRNRWDPSDQEFRANVWGLSSGLSDTRPIDTVQREFVAFVNPHVAVGRDRLVRELNENVAHHWIQRISPDSPQFVSAVVEIVNELLYNLSAHPFTHLAGRDPRRRDVPIDRRFALLSLFTTSGGGGDRLRIVVFDTGQGIPATLRPKFRRAQQQQVGDDQALVQKMLLGSLPPYGRAEGRGFPRLIELARSYGGSVHLLTGTGASDGGTLHGQIGGQSDEPTVAILPTCDMEGTCIQVSLTLTRQADTSLELETADRYASA